MNFIAVNPKSLAVCGRHCVYVYPAATLVNNFPAPVVNKRVFKVLELMDHVPQGKKIGNKFCITSVAVSENGKYVAVSDSAKNVYIFEDTGSGGITSKGPNSKQNKDQKQKKGSIINSLIAGVGESESGMVETVPPGLLGSNGAVDPSGGWELFAAWEMDKRITRMTFDSRTTFVVMADKTGDVWLSYMSLKHIKKPKKILGHSSFILDLVINDENDRILTCDRDEKIRVSKFPEAYAIDEFMLGHREAVVNIAVVNKGFNLISISSEGTLKLWKLAERKEIVSFNIFTYLQEREKKLLNDQTEVIRMRATDTVGSYHVAVMISGFKVMPIFEVDGVRKKIKLSAHIQLETDWADMAWANQSLFTFSPEVNLIRRYYVSEFGITADPRTLFFIHTSTKIDMHSFAEYNRPYFPIKKRVASEILDTVAGAREALRGEYGAITEDESAPMTLPRSPPPSEETLVPEKCPKSQDLDNNQTDNNTGRKDGQPSQSASNASTGLRFRRPPPSTSPGPPPTTDPPKKPLRSALKSPLKKPRQSPSPN